jgi:protein SCO1
VEIAGSHNGDSVPGYGVAPDNSSSGSPLRKTRLGAAERAEAFAAGPGKIPGKVLALFVAGIAVLAAGGVVADHFFSGPVGSTTVETATGNYPPALGAPTTPGHPSQLPASLSAMMGLARLKPKPAPGFTLTNAAGQAVALGSFRGKVVVLSFFDSACDDICPVLAAELAQAAHDLGTDAGRVAFVTINSDPLASASPLVARVGTNATTSLSSDWTFLAGPLAELDAVWKSYSITVEVQRTTGAVAHNDLLYFIDPSGRLRFRATPFADEDAAGTFSLASGTEAAWSSGIADEARSLLGATS